jgi:DNA polymerase I-like protein with 3'-5' exonuclease and polymerase domains
MIRAFENGIDLHRQTAALIFNKALDQVSDEDGSAPIGGGTFSERFWGKKANHSLNYDFGFKSFALLYEIPEADAKFIVDRYHTVYPGVRAYHAWVRSKLSKTRTLENCFGRKRLFLDRWGDELFKEAYAYIPQSTVAEKLNDHGLCFVYYNQQWFYPVELLNQIHDALAFQISTKHDFKIHAECILRIRDSLESPISWGATQFSIPVDLKVGFGMDKKKSKEVKLREYATVEGLARLLSDLHGEYRASIHV